MNMINKLILTARILWAEYRARRAVAKRRAEFYAATDAQNVWPPTAGVTTGFEVDGDTTVRWGTDGLLQTGPGISSTGYFVVLRFAEKELVETIKLPQGTGLTSTRVRI